MAKLKLRYGAISTGDRILWETDYAHATSTYPNAKTMRESCLAGVPRDERRAMRRCPRRFQK